jgi:hypothetical protein
MISKIRKLIGPRALDDERSEQQAKSALRARLIAVAVARTTHYTELRA